MKILKYALLLFSFGGLVFIGCSDDPQLPVSPSDQVSLEKNRISNFTGLNIPTGTVDPGIEKTPDNKLMMLKYKGTTYFTRLTGEGPDYLTGPGEIEITGITDLNKMTGHWHGKYVLIPEGVTNGLWQMTYHGTSVFTPTAWYGTPGWILSLQQIGHGEGGEIDGMQIRVGILTYCNPIFTNFYGDYTGVVASH